MMVFIKVPKIDLDILPLSGRIFICSFLLLYTGSVSSVVEHQQTFFPELKERPNNLYFFIWSYNVKIISK